MPEARSDADERRERAQGPPWILGHRGAPREAPENTLASLRRALELGVDGIEYDLRACASGEPILIHDATLERTTNAHGPVSRLTMPELASIDAGGWFHKRFAGEPLPLLEEALDLPGEGFGELPQHMIELKEPGLAEEVARQVRQLRRPLAVRVASFDRRTCLEVRDLELPAMLLAVEETQDDLRFVRDERIAAYATSARGWSSAAAREEWPCERWAWSVDEPQDLLAACRAPLFGFNTNEPARALATRTLVALTPHDEGSYPVQVPVLEVDGTPRGDGQHGEWTGRWEVAVGVRNPFGFRVEVAVALEPRGGAFELSGLPATAELEPGTSRDFPLRLHGGSWSPVEDPLVHVRFVWPAGPGRDRESLVLDAPLARVRRLRLGPDVRRLWMLRERPGDREASMNVRRRGGELIAWVENPGGLEDVRAVVRLGPHERWGARGVRIPLPPELGDREAGLPFCVGFEGRAGEAGEEPRRLRRWAGGLPSGLRSGAPGRLLVATDA
jgi:glycerophosphoryl diester phosphodiesterase